MKANSLGMAVNHNSPYLLEKADGSFIDAESGKRLGFDHRFMGNGEGAQVHGWGSYFSVDDLQRYSQHRSFKYDNIPIDDYPLNWLTIMALKDTNGHIKDAIDYVKEYKKTYPNRSDDAFINTCIDEIKKIDERKFDSNRHHYTVEIPDNDGTNYIEESKLPTEEQMNRIYAGLKAHRVPQEYIDSLKKGLRWKVNRTGRYVYQRIADIILPTVNNYKEASAFLHDIGFVGIHYFGERDGECYVIFDDSDAKIIDHSLYGLDCADSLGSIRTEAAPRRTITAYKLMRLVDGKLYPLYIDRSEPVELGVWYNADSVSQKTLESLDFGYHLIDLRSEQVIESRQRKPSLDQVKRATAHNWRWFYVVQQKTKIGYKNVGIAESNGREEVKADYALRPGWHCGSLPVMNQIGKGANHNLRDDSFVWTEIEISADVDYNAEAKANGGELYYIPENGYYLKCTNANKKAAQADKMDWYIAGAIKINRIISDSEARQIIDRYNREHGTKIAYDYQRESGKMFNADTMQLEGLAGKNDFYALFSDDNDLLVDFGVGWNRRDVRRKAVEYMKEHNIQSAFIEITDCEGEIKDTIDIDLGLQGTKRPQAKGLGFAMFRFSDTKEQFEQNYSEAVERRGIVREDLDKLRFPIYSLKNVRITRQKDFFASVYNYAKEHGIIGEHTIIVGNNIGTLNIGRSFFEKCASNKAIKKSDTFDVHKLSIVNILDIVNNSFDVEIHPNVLKNEQGEREWGKFDEYTLMHRLFSAVEYDGKYYCVKTTLKENLNNKNTAYTIENTKIELLDRVQGTPSTPVVINNSISAAILLKNVEKSYDKGVFLIKNQNNTLSGTDAPKYANKETVYYSGHAFDDSHPKYKSQSGYYPVKILFYKNGKYMVFWTKFGARKQFYATEDELSREIPTTEPKPETAEFKIGDRFVGQDGTTYTITNIRSYDELDDDDDYLKAVLERNKSKYLFDLSNGHQTLTFWAAKIKEMFKPVGDIQLTDEEKAKLRSYSGKGGSKDTTERGILDEYYTPDYVCEFMYQLAVRYGYTAGKVLEPSCATGNCIRPIYERNDYTHIDAFEINQTSREICKKLYPYVKIYENYFETAFLEPPRYTFKAKKTWLENAPYDLIIGNPPYGKHVNRYSSYFKGKDRFAQVEMFFMYKCLELLRSGGLLVFITSINFMSTGSAYQEAKNRIGEIAELVDAYRLPKVFEKTDICTDIIVLRKK